jgi:hypothetical protein
LIGCHPSSRIRPARRRQAPAPRFVPWDVQRIEHGLSSDALGSLLALPSSRVSVGWAQDALFPDAEAGRRIVICMRSASYWGLEQGRNYEGTTLFAPEVNRSGYFIKNDANDRLVELVRKRLGT